jgi:membrane protein YdbS with pleckstrin-like domain
MSNLTVTLRPAWRNYWLALLVAIAFGLATVVIALAGPRGAEGQQAQLVAGGMTVLAFMSVVFRRYYLRFSVSNGRIASSRGIIARNQHSVRIRDIRSIGLRQNLFQRIFNVGDLAFYSAGSDAAEVQFSGILGPVEWRERIETEVDRFKGTSE